MKSSIYIFLIFLLTSCTSLKKSTTNSTTQEENIPTVSKIIFLNYKAVKNVDNTVKTSLTNKVITEGSLKKKHQNKTSSNYGDFICIQQDINSVTIDSVLIANPFNRTIEYANDSGELKKKTVNLDSAVISTRMQLNYETAFILLKQLNTSNSIPLKIKL